MPNITLAEWAKLNGVSRRKAEMLAHRPDFPVSRQRRTIKRTIWQKFVPDDFTISDLST